MCFDPLAVARTQFAKYLWIHEPEETIRRAHHFVKQMKITTNPNDTRPFAQANLDKFNHGVRNAAGDRLPNSLTAHVDNCLYAEIAKYMKLTIACSVISCEDVLGGNTKYQTEIISDEKFNAEYTETRILLGHRPETHTMTVNLSPKR